MHAKTHVLFAAALLSLLPARALAQHAQKQMLQRYGMFLPRPVDPAARAARGYPEPRASEVVLEAIDALDAAMRPIVERNDVWKERFREYRQMQRERINLVSELEESGYRGPRLEPLLLRKLDDVSAVWDRAQGAVASYAGLWTEAVRLHGGTEIARTAEWLLMLERVQMIGHAGLHVAEQDYERLAAVDLAMPDPERAGILLLEALDIARDETLEARWHEWIIQNLPPETRGYRAVMRRRMFGAPLRLVGEGLDGESIDTARWQGRVILVDFWGTWCLPCKEAMPHLKELRDKYGHRGLEVVGVLCDFELEKARRWLAEHDFAWPQFVDRTLDSDDFMHPIARRYAVGAFPTLWIIDRKGVLRAEGDRDRIEEQILQYLEE